MAIVEVLKYEGDPDVFAWKYPNDELGTWTQLIVNESQEAILYKGGKALDVFASGRHTLSTANIPLLNKLIKLPFGGKSPFKAEVWFVNKLHTLDIKWGTTTPIQIQDPKYKVFLPVRAFGQFGIQIEDSKTFLVKLVGTMNTFERDAVTRHFKGIYLTKVKDVISRYLVKEEVSVLEINAYLSKVSNQLKEYIEPELKKYGIKLVNFFVKDINVPEEDTAVKKLKDALAKRAEMDIVGYNYTQERSFDTLEGAATNESGGQGGLMGAGIGLGMGVGIGGNFGGQMSQMASTINTNAKHCPHCNAVVDTNGKFCATCGKSMDDISGAQNCGKCNAKVSDKAKFCLECGERLNQVCPKCNKELNGNSNFCPECGEKL